ncbi:hypothetical protein Tco_0256442 [Tanacetum coccineum]
MPFDAKAPEPLCLEAKLSGSSLIDLNMGAMGAVILKVSPMQHATKIFTFISGCLVVRILQKSQENGQNTDTGTEERTKSRENAIKVNNQRHVQIKAIGERVIQCKGTRLERYISSSSHGQFPKGNDKRTQKETTPRSSILYYKCRTKESTGCTSGISSWQSV